MRFKLFISIIIQLSLAAILISQNIINPNLSNIHYGPDSLQVLDLWKAKSDNATPVLLFIHGGGFVRGEKKLNNLQKEALKRQISAVSINYRLTIPKGITIRESMYDGARALQFIRSKASEWNIDPHKIAVCGSSAGGMISLWLSFHDDLAGKTKFGTISKFSTHVSCAVCWSPSTTLDKKFILTNIGGNPMIHQAIPYIFDIKSIDQLSDEQTQKVVDEFSAVSQASEDDTPVYLNYNSPPLKNLYPPDTPMKKTIHDVKFGIYLKERLDSLGVECILSYPGHRPRESELEFLLRYIK